MPLCFQTYSSTEAKLLKLVLMFNPVCILQLKIMFVVTNAHLARPNKNEPGKICTYPAPSNSYNKFRMYIICHR